MIKTNQKKVVFLILNFLGFIFLYFYSFDFLFSQINKYLSNVNIFSLYGNCPESFYSLPNQNFNYEYKPVDNLKCVGQLLNLNNEIVYVGILNREFLNLVKVATVLIDFLFFIAIFFPNNLQKLIEIFKQSQKDYLLLFLIFFNFSFLMLLQIIYKEIEFFYFNKIDFLTQIILQFTFGILVAFILYLVNKLSHKNLLKQFFILLIIAYPVAKLIPIDNNFIYIFSIFFTYLIFIISNNKELKNIIITFLLLFTTFNVLTTYNLYKENISIGLKNNHSDNNISSNVTNQNNPVLILWLDEFPAYTLLNNQLDIRNEYKNLHLLQEDSYFFPFNHSLSSSSYSSLNLTFEDFNFETNYTNNYNFKFIEPITNLCPFENCNYSKRLTKYEYLKDIFAIYLNFMNFNFLENVTPKIDDRFGDFWTENKTVAEDYWEIDYKTLLEMTTEISKGDFIFAHIFFPHTPWKYFENGQIYASQPNNNRSYFMNKNYDWIDDFNNPNFQLEESSRQINQIFYLDNLIGEIINNLKSTSNYDSTTLIIASDHGLNIKHKGNYRALNESNYVDILNTPLIIKLPNQEKAEKVLNITNNKIISDTLNNIVNKTPSVEIVNILKNFEKKEDITLVSWDMVNPKPLEYTINQNLLAINEEVYIKKIYENIDYIDKVFLYMNEDYGWKSNLSLKTELDKKDLDIVFDLDNFDKSRKVFYVNLEVSSALESVLVVYKDKFKVVDSYEHNSKTFITFLLPNLINVDELSLLKFYENINS
jgi:hypothetical protein